MLVLVGSRNSIWNRGEVFGVGFMLFLVIDWCYRDKVVS